MTSRNGLITKRGVSKRKVGLDFAEVEQWERILRSQKQRVDAASDGVEFKNAKELASRAQRAAPRSQGKRSKASEKYGPLYKELTAKRLTARDGSGRTDSKVGIGDAFYGAFQELGTKHISARPFLVPAAKKQRRQFQKDAREMVEKLFRRTNL